MKYAIGQQVRIKRYNPWIGDYEVPATITNYGNLFLNGVPTYNVKTVNQETLIEISEEDILL